MRFVNTLSIAASAALIAAGSSFAASAQTTKLRVQTHFSPETLSGKMAAEFVEDITAMSNGEIEVEVFYSSAVVKSAETFDAAALSGAYTLAGGPAYIAELIVGAEMPTMLVLLTMMVILLFMGAFMDWVGIVLLIIPVFLPIVQRLPIEEIGLIGQLEPRQVAIWFGVLFCMNMQVSFLSPPFGPAAFYLKSVAPPHISLTDIFRGFLPFIAVQLVALSVLLAWPPIVTLLLE